MFSPQLDTREFRGLGNVDTRQKIARSSNMTILQSARHLNPHSDPFLKDRFNADKNRQLMLQQIGGFQNQGKNNQNVRFAVKSFADSYERRMKVVEKQKKKAFGAQMQYYSNQQLRIKQLCVKSLGVSPVSCLGGGGFFENNVRTVFAWIPSSSIPKYFEIIDNLQQTFPGQAASILKDGILSHHLLKDKESKDFIEQTENESSTSNMEIDELNHQRKTQKNHLYTYKLAETVHSFAASTESKAEMANSLFVSFSESDSSENNQKTVTMNMKTSILTAESLFSAASVLDKESYIAFHQLLNLQNGPHISLAFKTFKTERKWRGKQQISSNSKKLACFSILGGIWEPKSSQFDSFSPDQNVFGSSAKNRFKLLEDWNWFDSKDDIRTKIHGLYNNGYEIVLFCDFRTEFDNKLLQAFGMGFFNTDENANYYYFWLDEIRSQFECPVHIMVSTRSQIFERPNTALFDRFVEDVVRRNGWEIDFVNSFYVGKLHNNEKKLEIIPKKSKTESFLQRKMFGIQKIEEEEEDDDEDSNIDSKNYEIFERDLSFAWKCGLNFYSAEEFWNQNQNNNEKEASILKFKNLDPYTITTRPWEPLKKEEIFSIPTQNQSKQNVVIALSGKDTGASYLHTRYFPEMMLMPLDIKDSQETSLFDNLRFYLNSRRNIFIEFQITHSNSLSILEKIIEIVKNHSKTEESNEGGVCLRAIYLEREHSEKLLLNSVRKNANFYGSSVPVTWLPYPDREMGFDEIVILKAVPFDIDSEDSVLKKFYFYRSVNG